MFSYYLLNQVNSALTLNHTRRKWIDLGIHTEVCITHPETCGAAGGAISLWVNIAEGLTSTPEIVSSRSQQTRRTAIEIYVYYGYIQYDQILHIMLLLAR